VDDSSSNIPIESINPSAGNDPPVIEATPETSEPPHEQNIETDMANGETVTLSYELSFSQSVLTNGIVTIIRFRTDSLMATVAERYGGLHNIVIPETIEGYPVVHLDTQAFFNLTFLQNVMLPNRLQTIGEKTFANCLSLINVIIPDGVTSIGDSAFYACYVLEYVTIPDSVNHIGRNAFAGCPDLTVLCAEGSYAMQYCIENNINFMVHKTR